MFLNILGPFPQDRVVYFIINKKQKKMIIAQVILCIVRTVSYKKNPLVREKNGSHPCHKPVCVTLIATLTASAVSTMGSVSAPEVVAGAASAAVAPHASPT